LKKVCIIKKEFLYLQHQTNLKIEIMKIENITINRTNGRGRYEINGMVNGIEVKAITNDSEAFDYLNDEEYEEKQQEAIAHCERKLEES
jgi:hypothetical protein